MAILVEPDGGYRAALYIFPSAAVVLGILLLVTFLQRSDRSPRYNTTEFLRAQPRAVASSRKGESKRKSRIAAVGIFQTQSIATSQLQNHMRVEDQFSATLKPGLTINLIVEWTDSAFSRRN